MKETLLKFLFFFVFVSVFMLIVMPVEQAIMFGLGSALGTIIMDKILHPKN